MGDWGYSELRMFSYTVELCWTHITDSTWNQQISEDNLDAALIFLDRVHHATVTGNITDETRSPVVAEIYVEEIDFAGGMSSVEPVRSDSTFGRYYRSLLPGTYSFTFSLEEYDDIIVENVVVNDSTQTELNVSFTTLPSPYVINPLTSISFSEDTSDSSIDLNTVFAIDDSTELVFTYSDNSNISVQITDGIVELTPSANWNGEETITFRATAQNGRSASEELQVFVTPMNDPPFVANPIGDFDFAEDTSDSSIDLNYVFSDVDLAIRESLTFSSSGNDSVFVEIVEGSVILTPESDWFGTEEIIFTATDDSLIAVSDSVLVTISAVNDAPTIELPDSILIIMNAMFEEDFSQYVSDTEGDSLSLNSPLSENMVIEINDLTVTITPDSNWVGEEIVHFIVDDQVRAINNDSLRVIVSPDHLANPVISSFTIVDGSIRIQWDHVIGSTEYVIYSSNNPNSDYEIDESGVFEDNVWTSPFNGSKRFFRIVAKYSQ